MKQGKMNANSCKEAVGYVLNRDDTGFGNGYWPCHVGQGMRCCNWNGPSDQGIRAEQQKIRKDCRYRKDCG